jgi:2C-methyl-D-erythritol 2,4-cyclodiphosphate synthase
VKKNGYLLAKSDGDADSVTNAVMAACSTEIGSAAADSSQSFKNAFPASTRPLDEFEAMEKDRALKAAQVAVTSSRAGKCWMMDIPPIR